jgi:phosphoribosylformylglycinamidine synthase
VGGAPPAADLDAGLRLGRLVAALVAERVVGGVHDCSDGGLAVALAEMAIAGECGFTATLAGRLATLVPAAACFSESANRVVLAVEPARMGEIRVRAGEAGVPFTELGRAGGARLVIEGCFDVSLTDATTAWRDALPSALGAGSVTNTHML